MSSFRPAPMVWPRRVGAGERVLKTALAAAIAWRLGSLVPGIKNPYLAALVAILTTQGTIAGSLGFNLQRTFSMVTGVVVALLGINSGSVFLMVLVSLMLGSALRLATLGTQQVAIGAILVVLVGGTAGSIG